MFLAVPIDFLQPTFSVENAGRCAGNVAILAEILNRGFDGLRQEVSFEQSLLVRDIFGNPFRPITFDPFWRTSDVLGLARAIYDDRSFDRLPILADALMDAGCADEQILVHCRGPGPHVRGCWVVDLVLQKE